MNITRPYKEGQLVYIEETLTPDAVYPPAVGRIISDIGDEDIEVQLLDPLKFLDDIHEPIGEPEVFVPEFVRPIIEQTS